MKQTSNVKYVTLSNMMELKEFARNVLQGEKELYKDRYRRRTLSELYKLWDSRPESLELRLVGNPDSIVKFRHIMIDNDGDESEVLIDIYHSINSLQYGSFRSVFSDTAIVRFSEWSQEGSSFVMEIIPRHLDTPVARYEFEFVAEVRHVMPVLPAALDTNTNNSN